MPGGTFRSMAAAGRALRRDLPPLPDLFAQDIEKEILRQAMPALRENTPLGEGELRRGWVKIPGAPSNRRRRRKPIIGNPVKHSIFIDRGRRRSKKTGRMMGSKQAPRGIVRPTLKQLDTQVPSTLRKVTRRRRRRIR